MKRTEFPKLAAPARRALDSAELSCLEDLTHVTEAEVAGLHGIGKNALKTLREAMNEAGLTFLEK